MHPKPGFFFSPEMELAELVSANPNMILMLEHFGINMPFQGKTVKKICEENRISIDLFLAVSKLYNEHSSKAPAALEHTDLPVILEYLKKSHAYYTDEIYPKIRNIIRQLCEVNNMGEMLLVGKFFDDYFDEVKEHLDYENKIVFPYVTSLYEYLQHHSDVVKPSGYSVKEYNDHHNDIEQKLDDLRNLLIKYLPRKDDQQARRTLYFSLVELDFDLQVHARIEDLILIPLVESLERKLGINL
ncbi:MAG: hemerythrin domain-containing protein [Bacteroidales bacterium]